MIGKRVKDLRIKKGLSQQELGNTIGVTKVSICGYENGTRLPNLEKLVKLAEVLETTTDYLLGDEYFTMIKLIIPPVKLMLQKILLSLDNLDISLIRIIRYLRM